MPDLGDDRLAAHVGRVLRWIWDPIDLGADGPEDEYDAYLPGLVALTRDTSAFEDALVAHLARIEVEATQLSLPPAKRTRAARALLGLRNAHLSAHSGRLVAQWSSPDGLRCIWIFERPGGLYAYEEGALRQEDDENGRWSWWSDAGLGRSGLFDTAAAAGRDACTAIAWLRAADPAMSASASRDEAGGWRVPNQQERAVLNRLLIVDFPGRDGLSS